MDSCIIEANTDPNTVLNILPALYHKIVIIINKKNNIAVSTFTEKIRDTAGT